MPTSTLEAPPSPQVQVAWSKSDVALFLGVTTRTVEKVLCSDPSFPAPRYVGRLPRWSAGRIQAWVHEAPAKPAPAIPRRGNGRIK